MRTGSASPPPVRLLRCTPTTDGDTFINGIAAGNPGAPAEGADTRITLEKFEGLIKAGTGGTEGSVEVVFYDDDGVSIFRVTAQGS